ncbi:protein CPR-5 [Iris pallida]|uniref:Protein CPR-5 n=1 Tax=Iris pallida TaxID=29817 RepID=A0AAX6I9L1_IRIPA|nr:protein CPR-5 [Iris pallida]
MEQTRSNDLKAFEIGLISRKLKLKESQLALNSYSHMLEKIKITMGISKATFKEEKLRNQMLDTRHAELLRRCIDLLVGGLFIMSGFLSYGAYVFSYERITEATTSCSAIPKESRSWWIPKQVASFNSAWMMLRCHVVALSRMLFGLLMIVAIAYAVFQRSVTCGPTMMPMTFILLLMGLLCGISGKLCVDTLGEVGFSGFYFGKASVCFISLPMSSLQHFTMFFMVLFPFLKVR